MPCVGHGLLVAVHPLPEDLPFCVPNKSSGLFVDAMVFALTCAYLAVVRIDAWPISTWMSRMSVPASRRCVAKALSDNVSETAATPKFSEQGEESDPTCRA